MVTRLREAGYTGSRMTKRLLLFGGLFVLLSSALFLINQTAQIVSLANAISPTVGRIVLIGLLALYAVVILVPLAMILRMPEAIRPPADEQSPEYARYLRRLGARLATNPHVLRAGTEPSDRGRSEERRVGKECRL